MTISIMVARFLENDAQPHYRISTSIHGINVFMEEAISFEAVQRLLKELKANKPKITYCAYSNHSYFSFLATETSNKNE